MSLSQLRETNSSPNSHGKKERSSEQPKGSREEETGEITPETTVIRDREEKTAGAGRKGDRVVIGERAGTTVEGITASKEAGRGGEGETLVIDV